jgi:rfaE bifunctional protein kinase chain/domain
MKISKLDAINRFSDLNVLVLGDVMLDIYEFCNTETSKPISSEKPGKRAYRAVESIKTLGGAGNVAANLAALGVNTTLIAITGQGGNASMLEELAEDAGITSRLIADPSRPTTTKIRLYIDDEYLLRRDYEENHKVKGDTAAAIGQAFLAAFDGCDAVILSDYDKGFFTHEIAQDVIRICGDKGVPIVVDFKPHNREMFAGADIIAPNETEAEQLHPGFSQNENMEKNAHVLYSQLSCGNLIVTLGEQGICGFDGESFFHSHGNHVKAVDAVGCGDTVRVGLTLGYILGMSLCEAADLANDAAAVAVQKIGTSVLTRKELINFINNKQN